MIRFHEIEDLDVGLEGYENGLGGGDASAVRIWGECGEVEDKKSKGDAPARQAVIQAYLGLFKFPPLSLVFQCCRGHLIVITLEIDADLGLEEVIKNVES